jgi:Tol biopolymer transport system component
VAFTWDGERQDNVDIYVKSLDRQDPPLRLTTSPAEDLSPVWSPDGRTLAFVRRSAGERGELLLISANGGVERKLAEIACDFRQRLCAPAWSRDGRWIAMSDRQSDLDRERLTLVSAETGMTRQLTAAPRGFFGDFDPSFSPNGRSLAFTRLQGYAAGEVNVLPLSADLAPAAAPQSLTNGKRWARNPIWTPNGDHLLYVVREGPGSPDELRWIRLKSGENDRVLLLEDHISELSLGRHLVYSREAEENDIWRATLQRSGDAADSPRRLISSTRDESFPRYSPDGKKIAFTSNRSGSREIWIADADGSQPVQLTLFRGPLLGPVDWSPDGRWLTFHARIDGQADIFSLASAGGAAKRLTTDHSDDLVPTYSRDGQHIYFTSWRSGSRQIWKMSADGAKATQITRSGGYLARESPDRERIFYCHLSPEQGVWSVSVTGGDETRITGPYSPRLCGLAVGAGGLYYTAASPEPSRQTIQYFNFSSRENRPVVLSERPLGYLSLDISPDGRHLVYSRTDHSQSDLMLVRDFQAQ